ncbi:hypothetical protein B0T16DRAFT_414314 [Cercophora newfieldiana]|uniref:Uncharacterized protein n=1 Tax=Cercophora newfieldiana TaxID=92897 RepID=A0AA39Y6F9_9PEZI|nr:hypothetical protein B0T16DRAFT_414314 [Cercophora newfieldiana]
MDGPTDPNAPLDPELRRDYEIIQESNRRTQEQVRRLLQNRPQSWRHLLRLLCAFHFTILCGRFVADILFWGPRATQLNVISGTASAVALATRFTWHALFANPYSFMGYRRPSVQYRRAIYLVSVLTTVPAFILHVAMIRAAGRDRRPLKVDYGQTILALVLLVLATCMYVWMVRRFLLRQNDEHYEPTVPPYPLQISNGESVGFQDAEADTARDPDSSSRLGLSTQFQSQSGPLSKVYAQQRMRRRTRNEIRPDDLTTLLRTTPEATTSGAVDTSENVSPRLSDWEQPPHRCHTTAWFDYMPDSRLSDPLITFILMTYGAVIAWIIYLLIQENSLSKLPSSKAKSSLYAPLGVFLLCAFANKRFLRTSFFARIETPPPPPWVTISSLWSGQPVFRNSEDGSVAPRGSDPRLRVPINLDDRDYIALYNATAMECRCDSYWGHDGRKHVTNFRIRPVVYRFAFLGLAFGLFVKGVVDIFNYPTHAYDDELKRPDLTPDDLERQLRIMYLKMKLMIGIAPLVIFILFYTLAWTLRLGALWVDAMMRFAPGQRREPERQIQL